MRIAIIGGGISGMVAAYLLNKGHDIMLYEANDYVGGHTNTINVEYEEKSYAVDTGFIVFNEVTYPNFCEILNRLGVESQPSQMTFSVTCEKTGFEYNAHSLNTLFAQRRNLFSLSHYRMIYDIFRFKRNFKRLLEEQGDEEELGPYLRKNGYSQRFINHFIIPLGSSLWSADPKRMNNFPLQTFVHFFKNHGFLEVKNPFEWKVIRGGSQRYVEKLTASYVDKIQLSTPVEGIRRFSDHVEVELPAGQRERFDHVVIAVHSDQALSILQDASPSEREILGGIPYQENRAFLHTDTRILPSQRSIWASWNYLIPRREMERVGITYDMNILQSLDAPAEFCVTLNREEGIDSESVIGRYRYQHPIYTKKAPVVQNRHGEISGVNRTHYCGAYWGYGFHEDGVNSALAACRFFGKGL